MTLHFQAKHKTGFTVDSPLQPVVFPDGAVHIKGADAPLDYEYQIADARGLSHDDLFTLSMWADAAIERAEAMVLILPYLPGARMDRGNPLGARNYAEFIKDCVLPDQLITIDPHSNAALGFYTDSGENDIPNVTVFPVERIIRHEIQDATSDERDQPYVGVIAPDKGAHDRAAAAARVMGVPVYTAGKTRDFATGKLSGFHMEDKLPDEGKLLIVDDICDGGGTFIGLAEATGLPKDRVDLWVTHGIFSKGLSNLLEHFETIHTTDSYFTGEYTYFPSGAVGTHVAPFDRIKTHKLTPYLYPEIDLG